VFFRGVEGNRLIEIEIANIIDRQLVVEAEAVGEIEFHGGARILEWGGVLIAGGGAGCTDCFQDDAGFVGARLLALGGINSLPNPDTRPAATRFNCGVGIYPRWAAKLPQDQPMQLVR
jgi:hypothetical protein